MPQPIQAVVIGGGISGLVCAYRLKNAGVPVRLLEVEDRVGGKFATIERGGFLLEGGPQSFMATPAILDLIGELGLESELLRADPKVPRYVLKNQKLQAVPMSPPALLKSSLLSVGSRLKIALEAFRTSQPPDKEESVADFVRRKFGPEVLDRLFAPFVSGIYAGDPEALSLQASFPALYKWEKDYGSVLRAAIKTRKAAKERERKETAKDSRSNESNAKEKEGHEGPTLCSFRGGMKTIAEKLRQRLGDDAILSARIESIAPASADPSSGYEIQFHEGNSGQAGHADALVFSTPAYATASFLRRMSKTVGSSLLDIPYAPLAVVNLGFKRTHVGENLHGFGVLIPRKEGFRTLGTVWNSSLFPESAPPDCTLLTSFVGGATDPQVTDENDQALQKQVENEMRELFLTSGQPEVSEVWRYSKALPQYNLGHGARVAKIRAEISTMAGIFLTGNYLEGPSIGQCIDLAERTAKKVASFDPQNPFEPR